MAQALSHFFNRLDGSQRLSKDTIISAIEQDEAVFQGLIESLYSPDPQVCISAAAVLGKLRDRRAIGPLSDIVADDSQFEATRHVAARSLRRIAHNALFGNNPGEKHFKAKKEIEQKNLPTWLSEELEVLATLAEDAAPVWWLSGGEGTMLYAPTPDIEAINRERLPKWLELSADEIASLNYRQSDLPNWLGI